MKSIVLWLAAALCCCIANAQVPRQISYQGVLSDPGGAPVTATVSMQFKLYTVPSGGTEIYGETQSVSVNNGLFNVLLGSPTPIPGTVPFDQPYYLGITVGSDAEMSPRQVVSASPYALRAAVAESLSSGATVPGAQITGAITAATIPSSQITGGIPGASPWVVVSGATQQAASNTAYLTTGAARTTITLPPAPTVGDSIRVSTRSSGGYTLAPNAGQSVEGGDVAIDTWTPRESVRYWSAIASSADGSKLAATVGLRDSMSSSVGPAGRIYTSSDSGATWAAHGPTASWTAIASSADGTKLAATVINGRIYTSTDSGATWTARGPTTDWASIASSADGARLIAVNYSSAYASIDSGLNWVQVNLPLACVTGFLSTTSSADGSVLVLGNDLGRVCISGDSGATWATQTIQGSIQSWNVRGLASSADGKSLAAVTALYGANDGAILISRDGFASVATARSGRPYNGIAVSADFTRLAAASGANTSIQVPLTGNIYTSTNSGLFWLPRESARDWQAIASSADGGKRAAVVFNGQIYTSSITTLSGGPFSMVELVYAGNGVWQVIGQAGALVSP